MYFAIADVVMWFLAALAMKYSIYNFTMKFGNHEFCVVYASASIWNLNDESLFSIIIALLILSCSRVAEALLWICYSEENIFKFRFLKTLQEIPKRRKNIFRKIDSFEMEFSFQSICEAIWGQFFTIIIISWILDIEA